MYKQCIDLLFMKQTEIEDVASLTHIMMCGKQNSNKSKVLNYFKT